VEEQKNNYLINKEIIMKNWLFIGLAGIVLVTGACTPMFMVGKDGKGGFLGSTSKDMYEMLCASGDMKKVLASTHLSKEMKDAFYQYNCSEERSRDKLKKLYASMTSKQRKDLRKAFKANGYKINGGGRGCCAQ
jgi:hypothetical protein